MIKIFCALILGFSSASFARPFPSTGKNVNCKLQVLNVKEFVACAYGPSCPVVLSEVQVSFQSLIGDLIKPLVGNLLVTHIMGLSEANGGGISPETQKLIKFVEDQNLVLTLSYVLPELKASIKSDVNSKIFNLSQNWSVDLREGLRPVVPASNLVQLSSYTQSQGLFGQLSCGPELKH